MYKKLGKRIFDVTFAVILLVVLAPIIVLIAPIVRITVGKPVLFKQLRPGLHGKPFWIYKFRTMQDLLDEKGELLPDEQRLNLFGKFLRSTSLDELPEFLNIIRGEMSLVGPRPLLMHYLMLYSPEQNRRHEVLPGITGWAQINGRNGISWQRRFELDVWYVDNLSFWLDVKILLGTIGVVLMRKGVSQPGHATIEEFKGLSGQ